MNHRCSNLSSRVAQEEKNADFSAVPSRGPTVAAHDGDGRDLESVVTVR
jgi:hypothetical protein